MRAIKAGWDLVVAHPPCTYLATSGNRWYAGSPEREDAIDLVLALIAYLEEHATKWAVENPISVLSTAWRKPDQIIQPWHFGHPEKKATCLWLHNLPRLRATDVVVPTRARIHMMPDTKHRSRKRSITYEGIAAAMASQWG